MSPIILASIKKHSRQWFSICIYKVIENDTVCTVSFKVYSAEAELEPSANGFGDRYSTN